MPPPSFEWNESYGLHAAKDFLGWPIVNPDCLHRKGNLQPIVLPGLSAAAYLKQMAIHLTAIFPYPVLGY